jgi:hypothetical protein
VAVLAHSELACVQPKGLGNGLALPSYAAAVQLLLKRVACCLFANSAAGEFRVTAKTVIFGGCCKAFVCLCSVAINEGRGVRSALDYDRSMMSPPNEGYRGRASRLRWLEMLSGQCNVHPGYGYVEKKK